MKAVTPVIALVMLLLITVGIAGASYTWFGGIMSAQTKKPISIPPGGAYCADGDIKVYVLNNGDTAITANDIIVAQVDGVDVKNTPFFGDMRSGLVGYWKFDETSGTTAKDSSGNNNNGDLKPACPNCPEWKTGRSRNALKFDGVDDYVDIGSVSGLNVVDAITIGHWVKTPPVLDHYGETVVNIPSDGTDKSGGYRIYLGTDWKFNFQFSTNGIGWNGLVTSNTVSPNTWYQVTAVYDKNGGSNNAKIFIKGVSQNPQTITGAISYTYTPFRFVFGVRSDLPGWSTYNGLIDEVKIYNKAVGDVTIQPGASGVIVNYPGVEGRHTVRVGTSSGAAESAITCA